MEFHPFAEVYPMMPEIELLVLQQDMRTNGFDRRFPVVRYQGKILDGRNRFRAASEEQVDVFYVDFRGNDEEAAAFVIRANEHRRHLTPEWLRKNRQERMAREIEARRGGQTLQAIADKEKVSVGQVQRDLSASGLSGDKPETVIGKDGKKQASTKKKTKRIVYLCNRCTRIGTASCDRCRKLDNPLPKPLATSTKKSKGFDYNEWKTHFGYVLRGIGDLMDRYEGQASVCASLGIAQQNLSKVFDTCTAIGGRIKRAT